MTTARSSFIALGANLPHPIYGDPAGIIIHAVKILSEKMAVIKQSSLYRTPPMPISDQPDYANAVLEVDTDLPAKALLQQLHCLEKDFGRVRKTRNEARVLDLDLIDYQGKVFVDEELMLPHPRLAERPFVLYPLAEIAPTWRHPITGKSVQELIAALPKSHVIMKW